MILITGITILYRRCICIFFYDELFCICSKTSRLYYVVSCISAIFGEFLFSSNGVDFAGCSCIMKVYVNV